MLGPQTEAELQRKLTAEIGQPRFTRIDRAILREAEDGIIDLRPGGRSAFEQGVRLERVRELEAWDLARPVSRGVWRISGDLESSLRRWGERRDIIRAMSRALAREGQVRAPESFVTFDEDWAPVIGKVIDKGLAGPTEERAALIVDGVDGKVRRVECSLLSSADVPLGALIQTGHGATVADHTIADIAAADGTYRTEEHLRRLRTKALPLADGADPLDVVRSHVRRLEALRRARVVQRYEEGRWAIPRDFLAKAATYEQRRGYVRVVSLLDLEAQVRSPGATWLDRQLVAREPVELAERGFGAEVGAALKRRTEVLVARGLAHEGESGVRFRRGLVNALAQIEARQAGEAYARAAGGWYEPAEAGRTVEGVYREKLRLDSGMFAVVETHGLGFALVPWRPVIENQLGEHVRARLEIGGGVEWRLGRGREIGRGR
jgi:hypothetical protein